MSTTSNKTTTLEVINHQLTAAVVLPSQDNWVIMLRSNNSVKNITLWSKLGLMSHHRVEMPSTTGVCLSIKKLTRLLRSQDFSSKILKEGNRQHASAWMIFLDMALIKTVTRTVLNWEWRILMSLQNVDSLDKFIAWKIESMNKDWIRYPSNQVKPVWQTPWSVPLYLVAVPTTRQAWK